MGFSKEKNLRIYIQDSYESSSEWKKVKGIINKFAEFLSDPKVEKQIAELHVPGASSQKIERVITPFAEVLGFSSQANDLFQKYKVTKLRPDYYLKLSKTGIIIEVERGQTSQNNAALKDLWKVHICEEAHYLFLFVPMELKQNKSNPNKIGGKPFNETVNRLSTFFEKENYTNVRGLAIFGY